MSSSMSGREKSGRPRRPATLLAGLCAAALASGALAQPARTQPDAPVPRGVSAATRPNIVLILADDLGAEAINAYGGEYHTPRIDELARQGVLFTNAHATPLCTPTRVRLLTGMESAKNYKAFGYLDPRARTIGHVMKDAGYATAIVGKWQLSGNGYDGLVGASPQGSGFDQSLRRKRRDERMRWVVQRQAIGDLGQCRKVQFVGLEFAARRRPRFGAGMHQRHIAAGPLQTVTGARPSATAEA